VAFNLAAAASADQTSAREIGAMGQRRRQRPSIHRPPTVKNQRKFCKVGNVQQRSETPQFVGAIKKRTFLCVIKQ
jgi:hypothetical protein